MAKSSKSAKSAKSERQKRIDDAMKKQRSAEKRRGYAIVAVAATVALLIIGAAAYKPVTDWWDLRQYNYLELTDVGAKPSACQDIVTKQATGVSEHVATGQPGRVRGLPARLRTALERGQPRPRAVRRQALRRERRAPRAGVAGAQPRARLHDPLVRRDRRRRRRADGPDRLDRQEVQGRRRQLPLQVHRRALDQAGQRRGRRRPSPTASTSPSPTGRATPRSPPACGSTAPTSAARHSTPS